MKNIVITGVSRGLGLLMAGVFTMKKGDMVFGLTRSRTQQLLDLEKKADGKLVLIDCDVGDSESVRKAAAGVASRTDHIDILINNAGVNLDLSTGRVVNFLETNFDDMRKTFEINTAGPMRVVQAFDTLLKEGSLSVALSSGAGSIANNTTTEVEIAYRVSKTALNMAFNLYANTVRKRGVRALLLDPGWMKTDMGGPGASCDPRKNAVLIVDLLNNIGMIPADRLFIDYRGEKVPW